MERHERLRVGEQSSGMTQRLFKQHYAKMLRVARTILYDEQESKDVVSDIFDERSQPVSEAYPPSGNEAPLADCICRAAV